MHIILYFGLTIVVLTYGVLLLERLRAMRVLSARRLPAETPALVALAASRRLSA
jgi:hypothetical protein